ncbi:MAG: GlsB/YeaQ/YmgE family stress response membrane protein [Pyrinomonadaceae bacterium]
MFHILGQILVGLIIGVVARFLLPGKEVLASGMLGWVETAGVGIAGSLIGSLVGRAIWKDQNYKAGWVISILGAIALLLLLRFIF